MSNAAMTRDEWLSRPTLGHGWKKLLSGGEVLLDSGLPMLLRISKELYCEPGLAQARYEVFELTGFLVRTSMFRPSRDGAAYEGPLRLVGGEA
jgi:hypothetical protein